MACGISLASQVHTKAKEARPEGDTCKDNIMIDAIDYVPTRGARIACYNM